MKGVLVLGHIKREVEMNANNVCIHTYIHPLHTYISIFIIHFVGQRVYPGDFISKQ